MKPFRQLLIAFVCLITMAVGASAQDRVRIWQQAAGANFPAFVSAMQQNGLADDNHISTMGLGQAAYAFAAQQGHLKLVPAGNRGEASYARLFLRWNGLPEGRISLAQFRAKGQGTGFWLPVVGASAPTQSSTARATPRSAPAPTVQDIVNRALSERGLGDVDAFTAVQSATLTSADVLAILDQELPNRAVPQSVIDDLKSDVNQRIFTLSEVIADVTTRLDAVEIEQAAQAGRIGAVERVQTDHTGRLDAIDDKLENITAPEPSFLDTYGALVAGLGALLLALLAGLQIAARTRVDKLNSKLQDQNERLEAVTTQVTSKKQIDLPVDLEDQLTALAVGDIREETISVDGMSYQVIFTRVPPMKRGGPAMVKVLGIKDQTEPVYVSNIRSRVLRAAGKEHLDHPVSNLRVAA